VLLVLLACAPDFESRDLPEPGVVVDSVDTGDSGTLPPVDTADTAVIDTAPPPDTDTVPVEPECPEGVICLDWLPISETWTTRGGVSEWDSYACSPTTDESGPEVIYRVTVEEDGFLAMDLREMESGADVDVHLLGSLDPDDCYDRGHWAAGAWVPAGDYYVVADTWVNGSGTALPGQYTLQIGHVSPAELAAEGLDRPTAALALQAYDRAWEEDQASKLTFGIIDFSLHSSLERLWVWDLPAEELLWWLHVSHGEGSSSSSDAGQAESFSNTEGSHQSSLGMMVAAEDYVGSNGLSMRLDGLEPLYNDAVRDRAIVVHGADYARPEYVTERGRLGQSWGCPAVDDRESTDLIDDLQDGLMWSYYPDGDWSKNSTYL